MCRAPSSATDAGARRVPCNDDKCMFSLAQCLRAQRFSALLFDQLAFEPARVFATGFTGRVLAAARQAGWAHAADPALSAEQVQAQLGAEADFPLALVRCVLAAPTGAHTCVHGALQLAVLELSYETVPVLSNHLLMALNHTHPLAMAHWPRQLLVPVPERDVDYLLSFLEEAPPGGMAAADARMILFSVFFQLVIPVLDADAVYYGFAGRQLVQSMAVQRAIDRALTKGAAASEAELVALFGDSVPPDVIRHELAECAPLCIHVVRILAAMHVLKDRFPAMHNAASAAMDEISPDLRPQYLHRNLVLPVPPAQSARLDAFVRSWFRVAADTDRLNYSTLWVMSQ